MKYVRTKDGRIIKIGEQTDVGYEKGTFEVHNKAGIVASYEPIEVLQETDTIEELCDEFVQINKSKDKDLVRIKKIDGVIYYQKLERVFDNEWHKLSAGEYIFGTIWTDKGLIYVAKMDKKGELELL